jgi:hypothetical protein
MPGDAKLMDSTSNPSSAFRPTVIATTTTCIRLIADLAMTSRGSVLTIQLLFRWFGSFESFGSFSFGSFIRLP